MEWRLHFIDKQGNDYFQGQKNEGNSKEFLTCMRNLAKKLENEPKPGKSDKIMVEIIPGYEKEEVYPIGESPF